MLGSASSVSAPNVMLNTAVAETLRLFAEELEQASDFQTALHSLIKRVIKGHKRIIFNGNGYDDEWLTEAERRGLLNLKTTPDALPYLIKEKNVELFTKHRVFTERELKSRYEILMESYCKLINIEGRTMVDMAMKDILPAVSEYTQTLCNTLLSKKAVCESLDCAYEQEMIEKISKLSSAAYNHAKALEKALCSASKISDITKLGLYYKDKVLSLMKKLREKADALENIVSADYWCFPTYGELLFGV